MTDAMTDVTDEFIAEMSRSDVDTTIRSMAREIQRRRASDRWVPWKSGDDLPEGRDASLRWHQYWVTLGPSHYDEEQFFASTSDIRAFEGRGVRAYWSRPLPAPFDSSMGAEHG
jgi:hypothetical protein